MSPQGSRGRLAGSYAPLDDTIDEDFVNLVESQPAPGRRQRGRLQRNSDYISLDDLDEAGRGHQGANGHNGNNAEVHVKRPRALLVAWIAAISFVIIIAGTQTAFRASRQHTAKAAKHSVLSNGTNPWYTTTIVISLDGMHPHYVSKDRTPNLDEMVSSGAAVPYMIPSFPSQTFPNHWTMITGLYPENHGIVGNDFYDPDMDKHFVHSDRAQSSDPGFWGGEPIWKTAKRQGRKTAIHMWPGSEADWGEWAADDVDPFNIKEPLEKKSARLAELLDRDIKTRPELVMMYVPNVDTVGHAHGVGGSELEETIRYVDNFIGQVKDVISARNLSTIVNLVVVSDHGMAPTSDDRLVFLDDYIDVRSVSRISGWPLASLWFDSNEEAADAFAKLEALPAKAAAVYKKETLLPKWNFGSKGKYSKRLAPIHVVPKLGYSILTHDQYTRMNNSYTPHGVHGYDNSEVLMHALFIAKGPFFYSGHYEPFENVNLYPLLCGSLGLTHSKVDGVAELKHLEKTFTEKYPNADFEMTILEGDSTFKSFAKAVAS